MAEDDLEPLNLLPPHPQAPLHPVYAVLGTSLGFVRDRQALDSILTSSVALNPSLLSKRKGLLLNPFS